MIVTVPIRIESVANIHEHWTARARRASIQKGTTYFALREAGAPHKLPCTVKLTRVAPRTLDAHDNLRAGCKAAVDGVALWLTVDDADERITWEYAQEKGRPKQYALKVEIT